MLSSIISCGLTGINGFAVTAEINLGTGMPMFEIVGLPDTSVKESRERVRAALKNSGFSFPNGRITVNLAPADQKKEGPAYDLAIALGLLACTGMIEPDRLKDVCVIGELSLDGSVRPVRGILPMVIFARSLGMKAVLLPEASIPEVSCIEGIDLLGVSSLLQAARHLRGEEVIAPAPVTEYRQLLSRRTFDVDFAHVKGQKSAKRALEIAAAGGHNALMIGPPGSGKTLMARCMPTILPDMRFEEALETTRIHSVAGNLPESGLLIERPFRSPHHTASHASLVGGGINAMPGEISKAHNGVLFLDELPEYRRDVLEALRQPLEDGFVSIARVGAQATYPANFVLVCSMNPCPCGNLGSRVKECRCTSTQIRRYLNRISGPLLDRIDMHIEVESIPAERLSSNTPEESSDSIRSRVEAAREIQRRRYANENILINAQLNARNLSQACQTTKEAHQLLMLSCEKLNLSNRAYTRVLKVARTIADLEGAEVIDVQHVSEAVQYRTLDRKYWG